MSLRRLSRRDRVRPEGRFHFCRLSQHTDPEMTVEEMIDTARPALERLLEANGVADAV